MSFLGYAIRHGTEATFQRVSLGSYDPEAGTASDSEADTTVQGFLHSYRLDEVGGGIDADDQKYMLPASEISVEPTTEDRLLVGSVVYEIVTVGRVEKHAAALFYPLQIRRIK